MLNELVSRGSSTSDKRFDQRRAVFFNILVLFMMFAVLAMMFLAKHPYSKALNGISLIIFAALFYYHGIHSAVTIKITGVFYQLMIFIHSSILDPGGHVEYALLAMTVVLPVFFKGWWNVYFFISNMILFYYPYVVLDAYESYFKLAYAPAATLFFVIRAFAREGAFYEKQLLEKQEELIEINREKNQLVQIVAHDLKTPISQVKGLTGLLRLSKPDTHEELIDYIDKVDGALDRMSYMITRILNIRIIEQKRLDLKWRSVDPIKTLSAVSEALHVLADRKSIKIKQSFNGTIGHVQADHNFLIQVFENLLSNAIKYSPQGTEVTLSAESDAQYIRISVEDQGPGIPEKDQKQLFIRTARLDAEPTGGEDSSGLGLLIVKKFMDAMEGKVWCESTPGEGSTFTVEFKKDKTDQTEA
ncbi:MAG: HAMP domain-containing sensor histidine kinase [Bacteroidota bacterium]